MTSTTFASTIDEQDRAAYQANGAAVLRGVVAPEWLNRMRLAIDRMHSSDPAITIWPSRTDAEFSAFARCPLFGQIAAQLMGADEARFYYDQLFVKAPQSDSPTPLHQDLPYWPIEGDDVISIWIPFDRVEASSSVVQYVQGSHRWGKLYEPAPFRKGAPPPDSQGSAAYEVIDNPQAIIEREQILCWEMEPGDVLVHHPLVLHFARPNESRSSTRRAIALRYVGPKSQFVDRPGNFMRRSNKPSFYPSHPIITGAQITGDDYPLVWPA